MVPVLFAAAVLTSVGRGQSRRTEGVVDRTDVAWNDKVIVSPDCKTIRVGGFWASTKLTPAVQRAAREAPGASGEDILDALLRQDAPHCMVKPRDRWGQPFSQWYDATVITAQEDLEIYTRFPALIGA